MGMQLRQWVVAGDRQAPVPCWRGDTFSCAGSGLPRFSRAWYCSLRACDIRLIHVSALSTTVQGLDKSTVMTTAAVLMDLAGRKNAGRGVDVGTWVVKAFRR